MQIGSLSTSFYELHILSSRVEPRHSSKEALSQTGLRNEENTSDKLSGKSKSPKFVSPFKCQGTCLQSFATNNLLAVL